MKLQFGLAVAPFVLCANVSCAQNSILAGKILDENKNPTPDAVVKVVNKTRGISKEIRTDADGLYNISPLPAGKYDVSITARNSTHQVKKVELNGPGDYYNFILAGKKVEVVRSKEDPFIGAKLSRLRQKQWRTDLPVSEHGRYYLKYDSTGEVKEMHYGERMPQSR